MSISRHLHSVLNDLQIFYGLTSTLGNLLSLEAQHFSMQALAFLHNSGTLGRESSWKPIAALLAVEDQVYPMYVRLQSSDRLRNGNQPASGNSPQPSREVQGTIARIVPNPQVAEAIDGQRVGMTIDE